MRLEYRIHLSDVGIPRFSVEAQEGIAKLFTLTTLVLNVLDSRPVIEIVFHGINREDPERKITAFKEIVDSAGLAEPVVYENGAAGRIGSSSSFYQWLIVRR